MPEKTAKESEAEKKVKKPKAEKVEKAKEEAKEEETEAAKPAEKAEEKEAKEKKEEKVGKTEKPEEEQEETIEEPQEEPQILGSPDDMMLDEETKQDYLSSVEDAKKLLIDPEEYLKHGAHIGLTYRTGNMSKFIYTVRPDRLSIFSLNRIDERIRLAAKLLAAYDKNDILVIGSRAYARRPVRRFAEITGVDYVSSRFRPGSFTNPQEKNFKEHKILLVADPIADKQAVREAAKTGKPIIGVCDSNALTRNLDLIVPLNNKGKHSIALFFWLLARQYLVEKGELKDPSKFEVPLEDFISQIQPTKRVEALIKSKKKDKYRT